MQRERRAESDRSEIVVDESGVVLHVRGVGETRRLVADIALGESLLRHIHPDDRDLCALMLAHSRERCGRDTVIACRWARPGDRWSRIYLTFQGGQDATVCVIPNWDEAQSARRSEAQMRHVAEASAQGIVVRTQSKVLYMNESFAKLLGYASARECIVNEAHIDSIIHPDDRPLVLRHLKARISGEEIVSNYEFRLIRRDRSIVWVETRATLVSWDGQPASLSWLSDISGRKSIEDEVVRSKEAAEFASRTKTQFLSNMSHELRTPLNAILGFSDVMQSRMFGPLNVKYLEYASDIHRSGQHLLALVNDVLDLAKLEAGKLELREADIWLPSLVDDCIALLRNRAASGSVNLVSALANPLASLRADERAVKQLLLNFLSNALKFTPEGGQVTVGATFDAITGLSLYVSDTGIGMSSKEIVTALSPFGQVDSKLARGHEGTGLGLPICKSLMELHGGEILVTSAPNEGTTLTARFPPSRIVTPRAAVRL